jgi:tetratricopeptide (TPR) repeat protein
VKFGLLRIIRFLLLCAVAIAPMPMHALEREPMILKRAQAEFAAENYDRAIALYRQYLRNNRQHWDVYSQIGAAYYHAGLPRKGLSYLNRVAKMAQQKSFNYLYQGLSYDVLGRKDLAQRFWLSASAVPDVYGGQAAFELAALEYNSRNMARANQWLNFYLTRHPTGPHVKQAQQMLMNLREGRFTGPVEGIKRPDLEAAVFRYNSWSLFDRPHFWSMQLGYQLDFGTQKNPDNDVGIRAVQYQDQGILTNASLGFGPIRSGNAEGVAGYSYRQGWMTDTERVLEFFEDPTNISYQPFQLDLMERRHQLFGDYRRIFGDHFLMGVYGTFEYMSSGSRFSGDSILAQVLDVAETTLLVPWVGVTYLQNFSTLFYLYLRKELNSDAPEYSNKTYQLFGEAPAASAGLSHYMGFPKYRLDLSVELFQYEFIYNDYWLDFSRLGGIFRLRYEFLRNFFVHGFAGFYNDEYKVPVLKHGSCEFTPESRSSGDPRPKQCPRNDQGMLYQAAVYYNWSPSFRLDLSYTHVANASPSQEVYDRTSNIVLFTATMAFPTVERALRYTNRFTEVLFRKDLE